MLLGVAALQATVVAAGAIAELRYTLPDDGAFWLLAVVGLWLTPTVYGIGLRGRPGGWEWRAAVVAGAAASAGVGLIVGTAAGGATLWLLVWVALTFGWLGVSLLLAAAIATPGCEMRSLAHLTARISRHDRDFVPCPGPLQPFDRWEARLRSST